MRAARHAAAPAILGCLTGLPRLRLLLACRLTAEERRRHTDERRAHLAALWNSPEAAAERARRQAEENELASWLAGQPDVQFDQVYFTTDNPTVTPRSNAA